MVDIWLLFCVGITFLVIIFHILIDNRLYSKDNQTKVHPFNEPFNIKLVGIKPPLQQERRRLVVSLSVEQLELLSKAFTLILIIVFIIGYLVYILT